MNRLYRIETLIIALFTVSIVAGGINLLMKRKVTISPEKSDWVTNVRSDQVSGGSSIVANQSDLSVYSMSFNLEDDSETPFASMIIKPADKKNIDLDWMESVSIKVRYTGDQRHSFLIQFRNYEPNYFDPQDHTSQKYVEQAFDATPGTKELVFQRELFTVPAWWISRLEASLDDARPILNAVSAIDITTSAAARQGGGTLFIENIVVSGHWFPPVVLYQTLLAVWMSAFLLVLLARLWAAQKKIRAQDKLAGELRVLNETLEIQGKELKVKAHHDALTGVLNRRGVRDLIFDAMQQLNDNQCPFAVIMLDVDHFKKVNDSLGHEHGDDVLKQLTELITNRLRTSDYLVRWGGEEFLILCNNTTGFQAAVLAEQLRSALEQSDIGVTCSFGVEQAKFSNDFKQTLAAADKALYRAKENGRNRVEVTRSFTDETQRLYKLMHE